ncbi:MAG: hypothetical protein LBQ48_02570 [Oscillospiraceae bacterium]|jgi:hypothetical protein|nr:hypothetical protein [Oscillospiraceae bacterium]
MDDIAAKLSELLNSPEGLEQMKNLAQMFTGTAPEAEQSPESESYAEKPGKSDSPPDIDMGAIIRMLGMFKNSQDDSRSKLLLSLKPHLSEERGEKVDQAIKILRIIDLWPVISQSGLLNGIL